MLYNYMYNDFDTSCNCFLVAASIKIGVGIEFDTENSCRKYQVCKPVTPLKTLVDAFYEGFALSWSPSKKA